MNKIQYNKGYKLSCVIPIHFIIGRPTSTEEDPVIAKTIKIRMSSQR